MATTGSGTSTPAASPVGSYTLAQLVEQWRERLDDTSGDEPLWANSEFAGFADKLQKMLAAEMPVLEDRTTPEVCEVSLVQGDGLISLNSRITFIKRAKIDGQTYPLQIADSDYMDINYPGWDDAGVTEGTPTILVTQGVGPDKAYLYPPCDGAKTLRLVVYRLPLVDLDYASHSGQPLELDKYAHLLVHGIMWQAYMKQDSDTYDKQKAEAQRVLWEGVNGKGGDKEQIRRMVLRRHAEPLTASPMMACM